MIWAKIQAKWESGLTTAWLKQDPPVLQVSKYVDCTGYPSNNTLNLKY